MTVAALFIDPDGPYPALLGAENCWDAKRDARNYAGPGPVVAHPPCQLWTNMTRVNFKRYGGEHNRPGNDGGCFASALASVRVYGGVLEHPADSYAWPEYNLPKPVTKWMLDVECSHVCFGWHRQNDLWVCEVWQTAYGHKARKRTWLLYCGSRPPFELSWDRREGTHQIGWFDRIKPTLSKKEASRTPVAFAEELIKLAEWGTS